MIIGDEEFHLAAPSAFLALRHIRHPVDIVEESVTDAQRHEERLLAGRMFGPAATPVTIPETHDRLVGAYFSENGIFSVGHTVDAHNHLIAHTEERVGVVIFRDIVIARGQSPIGSFLSIEERRDFLCIVGHHIEIIRAARSGKRQESDKKTIYILFHNHNQKNKTHIRIPDSIPH